ncbi:putative protein phosphatase regulator protein [Rosellinia necatrix]|uniref:CBM21 domain-containing protein n=1 Tax=Rosellinia necatrix TaxID=77044 RepID=A0A1W2TRI3_ROSNE|nr:putative protein phosphatase regulator protein [Rosellinia necatrix]
MTSAHPTNIRQSPPPITDGKAMPPGAIISPPESSSEDEGGAGSEDREREIDNMDELKEAISALSQCRVGSPNQSPPSSLLLYPSQVDEHTEASPKPTILAPAIATRHMVSHPRSNTDSHLYISKSAEGSFNTSEEDSDPDEFVTKPPIVRKKSGELVRPALRTTSLRRRPSSMPGTPTFSKAVHFDSNLEHVRHFLQVDRPLAVSTGSSPADNYDSDMEYPFKSLYEWEIVITNFPAETPTRRGLPVRLERVWMSPDQKSLIGYISVANLAFQKSVACRFTFDYWKTTSEVGAQYHNEIRVKEGEIGRDQFQFSIKLSDMANLETKTLYFCIRYNVNGLEYWDNNDGINFQVDFHKKPLPRNALPRNGKKNVQGACSRQANALPRSNRRMNPSTVVRPKSMPAGSMDDFGQGLRLVDNQPIHEFLSESESVLPLKSSKSASTLPSDNLPGRLPTPSGAAFANRYDFGASLSAAKQAQKSPNSSPQQNDGLYMKAHQRNGLGSSEPADVPRTHGGIIPVDPLAVQQPPGFQAYPGAPLSPGAVSPSSTSIASASYEEILNKYCFFNSSKQSSPQLKDGTLRNSRYDGVDERPTHNTTNNRSGTRESPDNINGLCRAGASTTELPLQNHAVYDILPNSADTSTEPGNYLTASSTSSIGPIPDRIQYHHMQRMRDHSPFTSDSRPSTAISC